MASLQPYQLTARTLALSDVIPTQAADGATEVGKNTIQDVIDLIPTPSGSVIEYVAYVIQTGISAPFSAGVVTNGLTGTLSYQYVAPGTYNIYSTAPEFTSKTILYFTNGLNQQGTVGYAIQSTTQITITSRNPSGSTADGLMQSTLMTIRILS